MTRILVIDDDKSICESLNLYLTEEGYEVTTALTGEEGLKKFQAQLLGFGHIGYFSFRCGWLRHLKASQRKISGPISHYDYGVSRYADNGPGHEARRCGVHPQASGN